MTSAPVTMQGAVPPPAPPPSSPSPIDRLIRFCLEQKLIVILLALGIITWGMLTAPFDWSFGGEARTPVPVDAIPDIGENQQIVFTEWQGRSPQDVDNQITYPLTVALLGLPEVKTIRSFSMFGFSSIYIIFNEDAEFYWSRSRILEKLNALPQGTLPQGVSPALGPDATPLGQIFWYRLEGRDREGRPTGGWDPHELRSIQDWNVRYALASAEGVAEVASIGGYVKEYQIDADPEALRAYGVTLTELIDAVRQSNIDVGARTIEVNRADYIIRGLGFIQSIQDLEDTAVALRGDVPVRIRDVARTSLGPAFRQGVLTSGGAEAVGGVVVVRYGENPLRVIKNVKEQMERVQAGLPRKVLDDGTESQVTIVPFYDRTGLINETLGTLNSAIEQQILVTIIVVVLMVLHLRSSILISAMLPMAVLMTFIGMRFFRVDANIVALSGIAIAVGTIVDMGIVLTENILRRLDEAAPEESRLEVIYSASTEVGSAVLTAGLTTIVSFLPVFAMEAAEGKLFKPLAYTKTFALFASIIIALTILPALAHMALGWRIRRAWPRQVLGLILVAAGAAVAIRITPWAGGIIALFGAYYLIQPLLPAAATRVSRTGANLIAAIVVWVVLTSVWEPLGPELGLARNLLFVGGAIGGIIGLFYIFLLIYPRLLVWALNHKAAFLTPAALLVILGLTIWLGFNRTFGWLPESVRKQPAAVSIAHAFPGLGKEFMPSLDEGSFLYMPTTMPHASIAEATDVLLKLDQAILAVPEVSEVAGKIGRVESSLDPAPISMVETIIHYHPEYLLDDAGRRARFRVTNGQFERDAQGLLIPDSRGRPYRIWRDQIRTPDDIWHEIQQAAEIPGTTSAPKLQPIETRIVMLQSGFRAAMGIKVFGPDLQTIESFALQIEHHLKQVPSIEPATVFADRIVGAPYLEIAIDRERIGRYGISIAHIQEIIEVAIGGMPLTTTVEGRERYPVRIRYARELRDSIESIQQIVIPAPDGTQIPLGELAEVHYTRGPQMIRSEDTFLVAYVLFDKKPGFAEVNVVESADQYLRSKIAEGELVIPAGVRYRFAGAYENQIRATARLQIILPLALGVIFLILYFQFRSVITSLIIFSGIFVAWSGGFLLIWLYSQDWFMDVDIFGRNVRQLFQIGPINLSVAVWVGFLALFGIATDDGVVMATRLRQSFAAVTPTSIEEIRAATVVAGKLRIRACLLTTATTILALLPILTSTGRGSDIMIPMAIPTFGGMLVALLTLFVVPLLYSLAHEWQLRTRQLVAPGVHS
jgi:copper/silver efflux system protein